MIDQEIRRDGKEKIGNIIFVTFSTKDSAEKAITGINKTNKYMARKYEYETNSEVLLIQEASQENQGTELQNQKLHQVTTLSRTATKNTTYMYLIEQRKL